MDIGLVRLLETVRQGTAGRADVAYFLTKFSGQLLESTAWEDVAVTTELEYTLAEIQSGMEPEAALSAVAIEALDLWQQPKGITGRSDATMVFETVAQNSETKALLVT